MENVAREPISLLPSRLEALSDAIFAFAMTLLVLSINLPSQKEVSDVGAYIFSQAGNFWTFALSFLLLSFFWLNYSQEYHHIKKTSSITVTINFLILLFVVLMPFSTSLMNDFPKDMSAEIFFNSNFLVLTLLLLFNWHYCLNKKFIEIADRKDHIQRATLSITILPVIPALALILTFISPGWSTIVYLLIPLIIFFPFKKLNS